MARPAKTVNELSVVQGGQPPTPVGIMGIPLDKLAEIPVEKMEQLFALHQKIEADKARRDFDDAFALMQPELPVIEKKGDAHNSKYARWEDIVEDITPIIARHRFGLSFRTSSTLESVSITCVLSRNGHREETGLTLPLDKTGSKNPIQSVGSTTSYGKRYTACAVLNIVTRAEDDDGNAAFGADVISAEHLKVLEDLFAKSGLEKERLLRHWQISGLEEIRPEKFNDAKQFLLAQIKRVTKEAKA